jgi:hypothetical protein
MREQTCDLLGPGGVSIPLISVAVKAEILDFCARIELKQEYRNFGDNPIEVLYRFPIREQTAIIGFSADIGGKIVEGKIQEKEAAQNKYDDAIAEGGGAYLLEQSTENSLPILTCAIGNLPPNQRAVISIQFIQELKAPEPSDDPNRQVGFQFRYPFAINKSQLVSQLSAPIGGSGNESPVDLSLSSNFSFEAKFTSSWEILAIRSPSHRGMNIEINPDKFNAVIKYSSNKIASTELVVEFLLKDLQEPVVAVEHHTKNNSACAMLVYYPSFCSQSMARAHEVILLLDRSGSMRGTPITLAKEALQLFIRSLPNETYFNIWGFGSRHEKWKRSSELYSEQSFSDATKYVSRLNADLGGTELFRPLKELFGLTRPAVTVRRRTVIVLTDGAVANTEQVISLCGSNVEVFRVFTMGIGSECSKSLVSGIADAGKGRAEYVVQGESMNAKVVGLLKDALDPVLFNTEIDWQQNSQFGSVDYAPKNFPQVYPGKRVIVYGLSSKKIAQLQQITSDPLKVRLRCQDDGMQLHEFSLGVKFDQADMSGDLLHKLYAYHKINDPATPKSEKIQLSKTYQIMSDFCAFVAVESRIDAVEGSMEQRVIPLLVDYCAPAPVQVQTGVTTPTGKVGTKKPKKKCDSAYPLQTTPVVSSSPFITPAPVCAPFAASSVAPQSSNAQSAPVQAPIVYARRSVKEKITKEKKSSLKRSKADKGNLANTNTKQRGLYGVIQYGSACSSSCSFCCSFCCTM